MERNDFPPEMAMMVDGQVMTKEDYEASQRQEVEKIHARVDQILDAPPAWGDGSGGDLLPPKPQD